MRAYWALPAAFAVHDAEELFTMPAWVASHRAELHALLASMGRADLASVLPATYAQAGAAIGCVFALFLIVTAGASRRPASAVWRFAYGGLLGAFFLHAFTHVAATAFFRGYTPGVVTAVAVVAPGSVLIYRALARRGALALRMTATATALAMALFVPAVSVAFVVGNWVAPD